MVSPSRHHSLASCFSKRPTRYSLFASVTKHLIDLQAAIWNRFGASETSLGQLVLRVRLSELEGSASQWVPIGNPLPNSHYVLEPLQAQGPLHLLLGGPKLATQYLADPSVHSQWLRKPLLTHMFRS